MPKPKYSNPKYSIKERELAKLREGAGLTQQQAAEYFGLKNRNTIAAWELGTGKPAKKHRTEFIRYLWDKLKLRHNHEVFFQTWRDIMEKEWGWDELGPEEFPRANSKLQNKLVEEKPITGKPAIISRLTAKEKLSIGGIDTDMIVLAYDTYEAKQIQCFYDPQEIPLPPDILRLKEDFISDCQEMAAKGEISIPYNSLTYKLKAFNVGNRDISNGDEIPILSLYFGPTDYFTHRVTDLNVRNPVRDKYMRRAKDIKTSPIPEFATTLGINLNLITKDGYLIITERSPRTETEPSTLHTSVGEGLLRPGDAGADGAPDPYLCASRGTLEELGIVLKPEQVKFTAFCVHVERGQYSLFGWSRLKETYKEVEMRRSIGAPKDKWENHFLYFVYCSLDPITQFLAETRHRWSATGLASLIFSLLQVGYTEFQIAEAFSRI